MKLLDYLRSYPLFIMRSVLDNKALEWPQRLIAKGAIVLEDVSQVLEALSRRIHPQMRSIYPQFRRSSSSRYRLHMLSTICMPVQGKSASGKRASRRAATVGQRQLTVPELVEGPIRSARNVALDGYSLHAHVAVHAHDRQGLERLARYLARGPLASKRLTALGDGRIATTLKRPWRDGTSAIVLTRRELMERLAAKVPRSREHIIRYAGIFAPNHPQRRRVCKDRESARDEEREESRKKLQKRVLDAMRLQPSHAVLACEPLPSSRWKWSELLARVFKIDILECPKCGGRCKVLAMLTDPVVVQAFLASVGESGETPQPIRAPPREIEYDFLDAP